MLPLVDLFAGTTTGVDYFDIEKFIEYIVRDTTIDAQTYKYEDSIIRPRHVIALNDLFTRLDTATVYSATGPIFKFDGISMEVKTVSFDNFNDLLKMLEDHIRSNLRVFLLSVSRIRSIDASTFEQHFVFKLRLVLP